MISEKEEKDACQSNRVLDRGGPRVHQLGQLQLFDGDHNRPKHDTGLQTQKNLVKNPVSRKVCGFGTSGMFHFIKFATLLVAIVLKTTIRPLPCGKYSK
jgi:hypothetical protein